MSNEKKAALESLEQAKTFILVTSTQEGSAIISCDMPTVELSMCAHLIQKLVMNRLSEESSL